MHRKPHLLPGAQSALREMSPCRRRSFQSTSAVCLFPFPSSGAKKASPPLTKELSSDFSSSTTSSYYWVLLCLGFVVVLFFFWRCLAVCRILVPQPGLNPGSWQGKHPERTVDSVGLPALLHYLPFSLLSF